MFYLTTHSTHFYLRLYGVRHMVTKNHSDREETCCRHIGYSFQLATRVLLYASSHGLCYTSRGALAGTRIGDWRTTIVETWMSLEQSYIKMLMDSMPRSIVQCIERRAGLTEY